MLIASIEIANGHILEEDGCILSDSLIRCDQRHIRIHRRCLFIVVSGSHLRNVLDIVAVPVSDQTDLGMHLITFKNMSIGNLNGSYQHIIVSPTSLKPKVLSLMDEEIKKGTNGRIIMKMNSVTDVDFIQKVSEASNAGVKVDLIVRGICCILPGVKGYTENLRVTSIVGRYLEHPRIFLFGTGADQKIYIGSADMMTRNTEKRVEVACPVYDETIRKQLTHMLKIMLADNVKARE